MSGFRDPPLRGRMRAVRAAWDRLRGRPPRSQRVARVSLGGRPCKRLTLPDSFAAHRIARQLERFAPSGVCPRLLFEREHVLWLEFVEGTPLRELEPLPPAALDALAALLATLHAHEPRRVPLAETPHAHALDGDLELLRDLGVLAPGRCAALRERARALRPEKVWVGHDCTDAILKNFVREPSGRVRLVDAESLAAGQLLGVGFAKAALRWLGPRRDAFLSSLRAHGSPDFGPYVGFVELRFRAAWLVGAALEGKRRFVDAAVLEGLAAAERPGT